MTVGLSTTVIFGYLVATSLETFEIRPAILHVFMVIYYPLLACSLIDCKRNDLGWLFHVIVHFRPAKLSRAYLCVS